ncbi:fibrillin [Prunus dulcis]|uniref:Fibrillin n=1 Tax=Prunus dulcis TaxID=3755 RepID=A0A4Y1R905_PRUDU|nr:fibrillin [Prunus dulcis]
MKNKDENGLRFAAKPIPLQDAIAKPSAPPSRLQALLPLVRTKLYLRRDPTCYPAPVVDEDEWGPEKETESAVAVAEDDKPAEPESAETSRLKKALVDSFYGTDRGLSATSETRAEIVELITQLEAQNPTPAPTEALPLLNGKWILAYTSFAGLFPLLSRGTLPLVKVEEVSQTIDSENFTVQNSVQFAGPLATTSFSTNATFEVRSPKRVQIKFEEGVIGTPQLTDSLVIPENVEFLGQKLDLTVFKSLLTSVQDTASSVVKTISSQPRLSFPSQNSKAESWLLTTYLDPELRISRETMAAGIAQPDTDKTRDLNNVTIVRRNNINSHGNTHLSCKPTTKTTTTEQEQVDMEDLEIEHAEMAYWRTEEVLLKDEGESASMKRYFVDNPQKLNSPMTVDEDTALHIVASCCRRNHRANNYDERCKAVRVPNKLGNNVLHEVAMSGNLEAATFLVINFNKPAGKTSNEENSTLPLLDIRNELGESPLYRAAALGHPDLVQFFADELEENPENLRGTSTGMIEWTALWLQSKYPFLATKREGLPARDLEVTTHHKDDVESSLGSNQHPQSISWKKPEEMDIIEKIWKDKRIKHALKNLIPLLVEKDNSWQNSKEAKGKTISLGSVENLCKGDNDGGDQQGEDSAEPTNSKKRGMYKYNPLLIATITGIVPIVAEILRQHPQAAEHVSHSEQNILHLAIKHRQREILELLKRKPTTISRLNEMIDSDGNTILHQAADRSYYSVAISQNLIGPAMQLQTELRWMMGVKNIVPPHYIMHHNNKDQTAEELFNDEHNELLKSAQEWIKDTAESCSTVAVLVCTVVFAAAYTMPGGNEPNGLPVFHDSPLFWLFTCMDVVAIACSLSSFETPSASRNQIKGDNPCLSFSISNSKAESWLLTTYLDPELRISRETTAVCSCSSRLPDQTHTHIAHKNFVYMKDRLECASEIEVLKLPYDLAMVNDWEGMKRYYADNRQKLNCPITVDEDTALHIVASCCSKSQGKQVLEFLINLLPQSYDERCKAVRVPNKLGNNVLHEVAMSGNLEAATFLVSNFNKPAGKISNEENSTLPLLDIRNELGESPLYRAAALGHPYLVQFFADKLEEENPENLQRHFHRNDRMSILHIAVIGQQFRTALWLQRKYPFLATKREGLPARDLEVTTNPKDDVESSLGSNQPHQAISWKKPEEMDIIEKIWKDKRIKHALKNLIPLLVEKDNSWQNSKEAKGKTISLGSVENLCKGDNDGGDQQGKDSTEPTNSKKQSIYKYNPLLIATITGIVPIVAEILRQHPQAAEHVSHSEQNILHLAIKHRQREILELLKRKPITISRLNEMIDSDGNTILHQAADRSYYSVAISEQLIGPAMQLQAELRWMMGVKNILPPHYIMHHNNKDQTAEELFNDEHNELLKSAQEWIKDTAQSCSTVAVLVATVVFAAAYAMPGGNEPNGLPVFMILLSSGSSPAWTSWPSPAHCLR